MACCFLSVMYFCFCFFFAFGVWRSLFTTGARAFYQKSNSIGIGNSNSGDSSIRVSPSGIETERF